jgi:hypothetical protein
MTLQRLWSGAIGATGTVMWTAERDGQREHVSARTSRQSQRRMRNAMDSVTEIQAKNKHVTKDAVMVSRYSIQKTIGTNIILVLTSTTRYMFQFIISELQ